MFTKLKKQYKKRIAQLEEDLRSARSRLEELENALLRSQAEPTASLEQHAQDWDSSFHSLLNVISDPVVILDVDGVILDCNPGFENLLGQSQKRLVDRAFAAFLPHSLIDAVQEQIALAVQTGKPRTFTNWFSHFKDSPLLLETVFSPLYSQENTLLGLVCVSKDITHQKQREEALHHSEQLLSATLSSIDGLLNVLSPDLQVLYSNWKQHEYVAEAERGKQPFCFTAFKHRTTPCEKCPAKKTFKDGKVRSIENTNPLTGAHKEITVTPIFDQNGAVANVVEFVRDITKQKNSTIALKKSEKLYRMLFNSANDAIYLCELDEFNQAGPFIQVNDVACQVLGYSREELLRLSVYDIDSKGREAFSQEDFEELYHTQFLMHTKQHVAKDGTLVPVEINTRLFELDGKSCVISIARDIREREQAERLLRQSEERARAILAAIPDTMLVVDQQGRISEWFKAESVTFSSSTRPPRTLQKFLSESISKSLIESIAVSLDTDSMEVFEFQMHMPPHGMKQYEARIVKRSAESALLMVRDVSALRNTEAALFETNQRLRLAMRFANEGKWECDFSANVYSFDEQAALMLGYTPEEAQWSAEQWQERIHPEDRKQVIDALSASLSGDSSYFSQEYRIQKKDGDYIWISAVGGVVRRDEFGRPRLFMGINRNITERREAEQRVRDSEEKYRLLVHNLRDAVYTLDKNLHPTYISPVATLLIGYTLEELYSKAPEDCIHPDHRRHYLEMVRRQLMITAEGLAEQEPGFCEIDCICKDGSLITVEWTTSVLRGDDGSFRGFIGVVKDITERKLMERKLRESEERYRSLFENAGDAIYVLDAPGTAFLDANPITWLRLGYSQEELMRLDPKELGPSTDTCNTREKQLCRTYECEHTTKHGVRIPVEVTSQRVSYGGQEAVLHIARDISERRRAQQALEESEKRFRLIFNTTPVALVEEDYSQAKKAIDALREQGETDFSAYFAEHPEEVRRLAEMVRIVNLNPFTLQLFENEGAPTAPRFITDTFNEHSYKSFGEVLARAAQGEHCFSLMRVHYTPKGKQLDTKYTWTVVPGHESTWDQVLISAVDVTELIEAKRQADLANQAKSQFLSSMSHDIRTPLSGILGMLQLLEQAPLNSQQKNYAKTAKESCLHLNRLLADILDLSKLEAGKLAISHDSFRVDHVLASLRDLFSFAAEQAGLEFNIKYAPDIPMLLGDESNLLRILTNLVGNALKFTRAGAISVSVEQNRVDLEDRSLSLAFAVSDTGMGIPEDKIEIMFQPYAQGDYIAPQQGVGLGLSIVKQLVALMDGSISVTSEVGKGSTFVVDIPFSMAGEPLEAEHPTDGDAAPALTPGFKALVVEDDPISLTTTARFLEKMGGTVVGAKSGEEALDKLRENMVDVILLDVQLTRMNGLQVAERIRTQPEYAAQSNIPIIIVTAYTMDGDKERFLATGADAYLPKPLEKKQLEQTLQQILGYAQPAPGAFSP